MAKENKKADVAEEEVKEETPVKESTPEPKLDITKDYKIVNTSNGAMKRYFADNRLEKLD